MTGVERVGERRGGVERIREQRVEVGARRIEVAARRDDFVLRLCQRQAGLQRFEPWRGACLESILRGIAHASLDGFEFLGDGHSPDRAHRLVVGAAHVGADIGGDPRGLRFRHRERRVRDIDAALPLAGQFERNGPGEGPMGVSRAASKLTSGFGRCPAAWMPAASIARAVRAASSVRLASTARPIASFSVSVGGACAATRPALETTMARRTMVVVAPRRRSGHPRDYFGAQMNGR